MQKLIPVDQNVTFWVTVGKANAGGSFKRGIMIILSICS